MAGLLEPLLRLDRLVFALINTHGSMAWDIVFGYGTFLGLGLFLTPALFLGFYFFDRNRFPKNFLLLGLALLLSSGVEQSVKHLVNRPRPLGDRSFISAPSVISEKRLPLGLIVKENEDVGSGQGTRLRVIGPPLKKHSFPSGHSTAAFAAAAGLIYMFRRKSRWLFLLPAAFVGASRIACGVHYPLDVIAGALIGSAVSVGFLRLFEIFHGLRSFPGAIPRTRREDAPLKVMMVVGEASADTYGSRILEQLKKKSPGLEAFGVGGDLLQRAGLRAAADAHDLAIVGFTAVLTSIVTIVRIYRRLVRMLREESPDVLVCIDLPDFNLMLATQARRRSVPVLYFISPQFWAWRTGRVRKIASRLSRMVVAFPFEEPFYRDAGVPVSFHGHPLLETLKKRFEFREEALRYFGLDPSKKTLVLAPGSRRNEFRHIRAEMFAAGAKILSGLPGWQIAVPVAPRASMDEMRDAAQKAGIAPVFTSGDNFDLFAASDFGIICSETATLEAALAGLPMVIVYRGNRFNFFLAKRLVRIDRVGLPNIILGGRVPEFPELFQKDARALPLAASALRILRDGRECDRLRAACGRVRKSLTGGEVSSAVADEILVLARNR